MLADAAEDAAENIDGSPYDEGDESESRSRSRSLEKRNVYGETREEIEAREGEWKRDVEGDHPTLRSGKGSGKVEKGKPNPDPAVEAYLAEDANRHEDSSDSSQHPCPKKDLYRSKRLPNETNPDLPMRSNWADLSGSDTNRGFLHEERNKDRRGRASSSALDNPRPDNRQKPDTSRQARGRSRSRPRIRLQPRGKGRDKRNRDTSAKDSDKGKSKKSRKDSKGSKGLKGKGKKGTYQGPLKAVDNTNLLSNETLEWHRSLEEKVSREDRDNGVWKNKVFENFLLTNEDGGGSRAEFCNSAFKHLEDLGKSKNKRIYIGPGRDGSSDDKISIDLKFDPTSTKVTSSRMWKEQGYVKTTFVHVVGNHHNNIDEDYELWALAEGQATIDNNLEISEIYDKLTARDIHGKIMHMIAILHPKVDRPVGSRDGDEATMYMAVDTEIDYEDEISCFYCGEEQKMLSKPCDACGKNMCIQCTQDIGGQRTCMLADNSELALTNYTPSPTESKSTTYQKEQK